jgi:hypothetical protein
MDNAKLSLCVSLMLATFHLGAEASFDTYETILKPHPGTLSSYLVIVSCKTSKSITGHVFSNCDTGSLRIITARKALIAVFQLRALILVKFLIF